MTYVVSGGIVRNRAWVLPRHLSAVAKNKPNRMFYVTGDNTDETEARFDQWIAHDTETLVDSLLRPGEKAPPTEVLNHWTGELTWRRTEYHSAHMASERNLWARWALRRYPEATHYWVVDSDVLPEPDCLEKLLSVDASIVGAYVPINGRGVPCHMIGWSARDMQARRTGEESKLTLPHVATMVGCCYLVRRDVLYDNWPSGDPWGEHKQGEDGWFADRARRVGYSMMVHPGAKCQHLMEKGDI